MESEQPPPPPQEPTPPEDESPPPEETGDEPVPGGSTQGRSGTSIGTWIAVFGSSTLFHVLLLVLLGMIVISERRSPTESVTLNIPEEDTDKEETIVRKKDIEREIKKKSAVDQPQVKETEDVKKTETELNEKVGENIDFTSPSRNDQQVDRQIALKGGTGRQFGNRGEAGNLTGGGGPSGSTQKAVDAALTWLAKHQADDGRWDVDNYTKQCPEENRCEKFLENRSNTDIGVTGLALLAFLGAGHDQTSQKKLDGIHVGSVVNNALRWLRDQQKNNGYFDSGSRQMYSHALATMAYAEAYGMTAAPRLQGIAQKAVDFLQKAQNENEDGELLGWRYGPNSGDNDTSVVGWCIMALKSAELAGLETSEKSMQGGLRWVNKVTNQRGLTGYSEKPRSRNQAYRRRSLTPVGMLVRMFAYKKMTKQRLKVMRQGAEFIVNNLPEWQADASYRDSHNPRRMGFYYWYYGSLTLFMFSGPGTPFEKLGYWKQWNGAMQKAVLSGLQTAKDGHEVGSWDPYSRWSDYGGRIYATAINALTLEVYYRYDNALFQ